MKKSKQLGGKRAGAGRPKGEKKVALGLRVPAQHKDRLQQLVRDELTKLSSMWYVTYELKLKQGTPVNNFYFRGTKEDCEIYIDTAMLAAHG